MDEYSEAFQKGVDCLADDCDLRGLYGRTTRGVNEDDFSRLSQDPHKRLSWVFDHDTLRRFLQMSHLEILIDSGHTPHWIQHQLDQNRKFKLIVCALPVDEVKLATWDGLFQLLSKVYPEINSTNWSRYASELKEKSIKEIDPEGIIVKNYYLGAASDEFINTKRF